MHLSMLVFAAPALFPFHQSHRAISHQSVLESQSVVSFVGRRPQPLQSSMVPVHEYRRSAAAVPRIITHLVASLSALAEAFGSE